MAIDVKQLFNPLAKKGFDFVNKEEALDSKYQPIENQRLSTTDDVSFNTINGGTLSGTNSGDQSSSDFTHNDLSSLQGGTTDEYYHLTSAQHTLATGDNYVLNTGDTMTGDLTTSGSITGGNTRIDGDGIDFKIGAGKHMRFQNYTLDYGFEFWGNDGILEHLALRLTHVEGADFQSHNITTTGTLSTGAITQSGTTLDNTYVNLTGDTMNGDLSVPDEAYGSGWDGSAEVPTKNSVYNKIETLSGGYAPMIILSKSSSVNQNVGGANGTEVFWTWDGEIKKDTGFTHSTSTNSERVQVDADGWYEIHFIGGAQTTGSARTTLQGIHRVDGGTTSRGGSLRNYARGSAYGNMSPGLMYTLQLSSGSYIEVGTRVEDSDSTYTINTSGGEISDDSHYLRIIKVG